MEDRQQHLRKRLESQGRTLTTEKGDNTLLNSALSGTNFERDQLRHVEKKIAKWVTESVEQLGEIIKDYARRQRKIDGRIADVEVKVFGSARSPATGSKQEDKRKAVSR